MSDFGSHTAFDPQPAIDEARLQAELDHLATFTHAEPVVNGTAVTRIVFTAEDLAARAWLKAQAQAAGLSIREDAVGNTFFRLEGSDPSLPAIATGSHVDAIPHAGMFDGTVGVLGGLAAMRAIQSADIRLRRAIELIVFTAEEPTRFGIGCLGSRLLSGSLAPEEADALADGLLGAQEGRTLRDARAAASFKGSLETVRLQPGHYRAFIELHIEQGPILERNLEQIGLVTSIAAPASYRFTVEGYGGHAGALLMADRRDALCAAAELILSAEQHARATGSIDTVATVGACDIHPGAVNAVPSRVTLQLDIRDTDAERRESVMRAIRRDVQQVCARRGVLINEELVNADPPAQCSPELIADLTAVCTRHGFSHRLMVSRAYHDALFMAAIAPVAMIFIPSCAGISHRPDEFTASVEIARGAQVLAEYLVQASQR